MKKISVLIIGLFTLLLTTNVFAEEPPVTPLTNDMVFWITRNHMEAGIDYAGSMVTIKIWGIIPGTDRVWTETQRMYSGELDAITCRVLSRGYIEITMFGGSAYGYLMYSPNFGFSNPEYLTIDVYKSALPVIRE